MVWDESHKMAIRPLREEGDTTQSIRDPIPAWSVVRQLWSKDRFALDEAGRPGHRANLDLRSREADEVVRGGSRVGRVGIPRKNGLNCV
jgi:hypothetical protein